VTDKASPRNRFGWLSEENDLEVKEVPREEAPTRGAPVAGVPDLPAKVPGVAQRRRRNRPKNPKALRNDPRRMMAGARIRKDVRRRVDQALADPTVSGEGKVNYSLLVEGLLVRWLEEVGYALTDED
jgi:hypothetical protein